ncbi:lysine N(6)-hydroxylase/L-ornithine N(5)-oxygenase family protein [Streptomyces goshikiensis]|uniref:lysine N(6)-hydroxylase/L-ornithine N(5)-oxygenase family protein n=1 Tax=Streptomyces goshikiensis TaxID=1942 RepID=UPI0036AE3C3F
MSAPHAQTTPGSRVPGTRDLVGIGFGPANLALAIAIEEHNAQRTSGEAVHATFVERQEGFGWHRGMLLEGATMQVSFLKDLVTMRNPGSPYSFVHYLQDRGRLADFVNHKTFFPTRIEFHDYFRWCAAAFRDQVRYGAEVASVTAAGPDAADLADLGDLGDLGDLADSPGTVDELDVTTRGADGATTLRARNVVIGTGLEPRLPAGIETGERIWHNRDLLHRAPGLTDRPHRRFLVVGAGQSAAETADYLHRTFPDAEVCAVFRRYGYSPADDSPFANRIFDPAAVDAFYGAPQEVKHQLLGYHANTNYSVVDGDLIEQLYRTAYQEKVSGTERLRIMGASEFTAVTPTGNGVRATVRSLTGGETLALDCDAVVLATGYRPTDPLDLLGELAGECRTDGQGRLRVGRDHRVETTGRLRAGIYLQGAATEHTHGITSSLLSTLAVRSGEIRDALLLRGTERELRRVPAVVGVGAGAGAAAGPGSAPAVPASRG